MTDAPSKASLRQKLQRILFGAPIPTSKSHHERLSSFTGLAVFSSDALSSVAYATEAILGVLILMSVQALSAQIWISLAIVGLIAIIAFSYRQTIRAYAGGGGSYIVASDNLGPIPGVVAGSALLIDYILTVAVSIAAGAAAITSAYPALSGQQVPLSLIAIVVVTWLNLRGLKESGALFAFPTYGFVVCMFVTIGMGVYRSFAAGPITPEVVGETGLIGKEASFPLMFILLRAFAAGCTALTGIEAVADGVQSFQAPEQKNAIKTLTRMAVILSAMFLGMGYLAMHLPKITFFSVTNPNHKTLAAQIAAFAFGSYTSPLYYIVQAFTALILILAANTAFADFPRLASFLARDGFLPRYMSRQGDRLVFHNGIVVLAVAAAVLVVVFKGELELLLPLYAVGVFTAFSLSQSGMVAHWWKHRESGWKQSFAINLVGALLCVAVLIIILVTKFTEGAWVVAVLMPVLCAGLWSIRVRYRSMAQQLEIAESSTASEAHRHVVLLLVPRMNKGILSALDYARQLKGDIKAVHVTINEKALPDLQRKWGTYGVDIPLVVLPSPYRSLIAPVLEYVDRLREDDPDITITVIVSEAVSTKWFQRLLHENVAQQLKVALARRSRVVVSNVRYFLN